MHCKCARISHLPKALPSGLPLLPIEHSPRMPRAGRPRRHLRPLRTIGARRRVPQRVKLPTTS
ncbi:uncharacterized protein SCHCODRAFT_02617332 [Schizophyllum commune H4-8]|uniref:uncharacterized protein n=1 Tax=Schizophyllum commune (strain H4-8 / FGSC 9210) TaxID=578458 RepID=UPI00215F6AAD|nr:uncharacterized protein SCHCODRAFT_02617332 [Schizophyllum commune H4-8]KAI5894592.1 hypothetical protein SCHCODRAFT_02617332 [Schizophyllum commune H4-8]